MAATRFFAPLAALLLAVPAAAALPAPATTPEAEANAPAAAIADTTDAGSDARIAERISGIFGELPAFAGVEVDVSEGVVKLTGTVQGEDAVARAEAIASRVTGVVTVENELERDVSIEGAGAVGGLAERVESFTRIMPLLGFALALWVAISLLGYLLAGVGGIWRRLAPNSFLAELIASAIRFVFVVGGLVIALDVLGATALLGAVLGGAGLVGIALGFAMRDTIENYVASLMLSLRQPFRANDHVVIEDREGRVIRLTSRATILMTLDGNHLRIPNSTVFKAVILNYTRNPQRRFDFDLGIDADDDPVAAQQVGREALAGLDFVLPDPPPEVHIVEVGESNIVLKFLAWIDQREADWFKARSRGIAKTKTSLEGAGFALPEPIYRLRFDPRSTPLPLANVEDAEALPVAESKRPAPTPVEPSEDVAPSEEIAEMVTRERRQPTEGQEKDLLDSNRPIE